MLLFISKHILKGVKLRGNKLITDIYYISKSWLSFYYRPWQLDICIQLSTEMTLVKAISQKLCLVLICVIIDSVDQYILCKTLSLSSYFHFLEPLHPLQPLKRVVRINILNFLTSISPFNTLIWFLHATLYQNCSYKYNQILWIFFKKCF